MGPGHIRPIMRWSRTAMGRCLQGKHPARPAPAAARAVTSAGRGAQHRQRAEDGQGGAAVDKTGHHLFDERPPLLRARRHQVRGEPTRVPATAAPARPRDPRCEAARSPETTSASSRANTADAPASRSAEVLSGRAGQTASPPMRHQRGQLARTGELPQVLSSPVSQDTAPAARRCAGLLLTPAARQLSAGRAAP